MKLNESRVQTLEKQIFLAARKAYAWIIIYNLHKKCACKTMHADSALGHKCSHRHTVRSTVG